MNRISNYGYIIERKGFEGQVATAVPNLMRGQYHSKEPIPFGRALTWDEPYKSVRLPNQASDVIIGFSSRMDIYDDGVHPSGDYSYPAQVKIQIMEYGEMYLFPDFDVDINVSDRVYVRYSGRSPVLPTPPSGGQGSPVSPPDSAGYGKSTGNQEISGQTILLPTARWMESGKAGTAVRIHLLGLVLPTVP